MNQLIDGGHRLACIQGYHQGYSHGEYGTLIRVWGDGCLSKGIKHAILGRFPQLYYHMNKGGYI